MATTSRKTKRHMEICKEMNSLYDFKNSRYSDSFAITFAEYGPAALLMRLDDKISRLKSLIRNNTKDVGDEPIVDTLKDLANYSIMGIMELEEKTPQIPLPPQRENKEVIDVEPESVETESNVDPLDAELSEYSKAELILVGNQFDLKLNKKMTKDEIIKQLKTVEQAELLNALDSLGDDENDETED